MAPRIDPTTVQSISWETTTCDRCGGTGYMPFAAYGGVCFKCNKHGVVLTPAGRAARKAYMEARDAACARKAVRDLQVGDKFRAYDGKLRTVVSVTQTGLIDRSTVGTVTTEHVRFTVETQKMSIGMSGDQEVLIWSPGAFLAGVTKVVNRKGSVLTFKTAEEATA